MARRKVKPRSYWEPWIATKSKLHGDPPVVEGFPEEAAQKLTDAWNRSDQNADWVLWGSGMVEPCVVQGIASGRPQVMDGGRIIAVRRWLGVPEGSPGNEDVCKRIAECVNALAGVADPEAFVADARALLLAYATGENAEDPRSDARVVSLLGRCIPPEELEKFGHDHEDR